MLGRISLFLSSLNLSLCIAGELHQQTQMQNHKWRFVLCLVFQLNNIYAN